MLTKRAIGDTLLTPEVLGAIIGGTGAPIAAYLVRRKKKMPALQRLAELLAASALGAGAGAGIGYGGKKLGPKVIEETKRLAEKVESHAKTPEGIGAIIGGTLMPLFAYISSREKDMPAWRLIAEMLGAGALGAGAGAGIGYAGKKIGPKAWEEMQRLILRMQAAAIEAAKESQGPSAEFQFRIHHR